MRRLLFVACASSLLPLTACGGGSGGNPVKPTPTAVSVTITPGDDFILVGESVQFSASVSLSDGSSSTQSGTWGSDAPTVAAVDATGKTTALASGKATIYVDIQNHRGTRLVTVMPNFKGEWHGGIVLDACRQNGDFATADFCGAVEVRGSDTIELHITQSRTTLLGTIDVGGYSTDLNGTVADNGTMSLSATIPAEEGGLLTIKNWAARSDTPGTMTGTFTIEWSATGVTGTAEWDMHLSGTARTSAGPLSAEWPGAPRKGTLFNAATRVSVGRR